MNTKTKSVIVGASLGLLIVSVVALFEVPSFRAIARLGAFASLMGLAVVTFARLFGEEPAKKSMKSTSGFGNLGLMGLLAVIAIAGIASVALTETHTVKGGYIGVKETFGGGVDPQPQSPKTYIFFRPAAEFYDYDIQPQKFENSIEVKSADNQRVHIPYTLRWHRSSDKVVWMHSNLRNPLITLEPESVKVVNTLSTARHAIEIYSGETQNKLRSEIEHQLQTGDLAKTGVIVDQFVFGKIELDKNYTNEIELRQVAVVAQSRASEQTKAALAQADVAKATAQADLNTQVVAAQRDKDVAILQQQAISEKSVIDTKAKSENVITTQKADSEKQVLAARANAEAVIANAEAQKQQEVQRAVGILAVGKAEAEANKLKLESFQGTGGENYTKIEVAKQVAVAFSNNKGYLPANMSINLLTDSFDKSVNLLLNGDKAK